MNVAVCAKVLSRDFSVLSRPEKQKALEESKQKSRKLILDLQKAREVDPQQLREPCRL